MLKILSSIFIIYCLIAITLYIFQRNLLYLPDRSHPHPSEWGVPSMQEVELQTEDGLTINAWYQPAQPGKPTLVYFHGNGGHIGYRGFIVKPYIEQGYGVLLVSYRGYGGNPGRSTERGLYADGRAAMAFLNQQNVPDSCRVLYGESLGCAVAIQLATEYKVSALILQAPFNRLADIAFHHYPFLPVNLFLKDRYESEAKISQIHVPILVLHGKDDRIVPTKFSQALFNEANEPKEYVQYEALGHNNLDVYALVETVEAYLTKHVKC